MKKVFLILGSLFTIFLLVDFAIGLANTDFNYWALEKRLSVYSNKIGTKDAILTYEEKDNGKQIYRVKVDGSYYEYQNDTESKFDESRAHDGYVSYDDEEIFFKINDEEEMTIDSSKSLLCQNSQYYYSKKDRIYYELLLSKDESIDEILEEYEYRVRRFWLYYEIIVDIDSKTDTKLIVKINAFLPNSYTITNEIKSSNEKLENKIKKTVKFTNIKPRNVLNVDNKFDSKKMEIIEDYQLNDIVSSNKNVFFQAYLAEGYYAIKPISEEVINYGEDTINYRIIDGNNIIKSESNYIYSNFIFEISYNKEYKFLVSTTDLPFQITKMEGITNEKILTDIIKGRLEGDLSSDKYTYSSDEIKYYQIENKSNEVIHILYRNNGVDERTIDISPNSFGYYQSLSGNNEIIVMPPYLFGNSLSIDYELSLTEVSASAGRSEEKIYITNENSLIDFLVAPNLADITLYVNIQEEGFYHFYFNDSSENITFSIEGKNPFANNEFFLDKGEYVVKVSAKDYVYGKIRIE